MSDPGLPATGLPGTSRSVLHPERLQRVLDALRILSPTAFALGDEEPIDLAARHIVASGAASGDTFAAILQGHLYNMAYVRQWPDGDPPLDANWTPPPDAALMTRLAALRPERLFDGGWQVRSVRPDGGAVLDKNGWTRSAEAGRWGYGDKGHAWVEVPGLHPDAASTFAFLRGRTAGDGDDQGNLFRVYLHTRPGCAADVLEAVVSTLDAQCLPFTLKTLMAPASAARADATVLYLSRRYQRAALTCLGRLPEALLEQLGHATPLFALPLRPGLSVAEDPPTGESFGMHRLRLVVRAVLKLWRQGIQDGAARRDAVEKGFAAAGLRFDTPHLGPGSTVAYELYPERAGPEPTSDPASVDPLDIDLSATDPPRTTEPDGEDLEVAARIGARLCRDALWHAGRCTWQGWAMMQRGADDQFVWRSLGPDLYRGTAGICLFLARLHAATGEPGLRETVAGGMAQALAGQDRLEPDVRIGLHTGLAGIGHAAIECGTLLERQDLIDDGLDALELIGGADLRPAMFDVVSGAAGCLAVLLAAAARYQRPRLLEIALRLGDFLVEQARPMDGGVAW
ncbi:MAG: T3SS effector HopA1 family protein, partial [Acidobacteriota bacterium]